MLVSFSYMLISFNCFDLSDPRIVLLGMASALFDASLYVYVIEWTPALQGAQDPKNNHPLPFGIIFAIFSVRVHK
jgi:hypothetical protein